MSRKQATPAKVDPSSIDLRLDHISEAKVWNIEVLQESSGRHGLRRAAFQLRAWYKIGNLTKFLVGSPPDSNSRDKSQKVYQSGGEVS